jgi:hypothetical protein
MALALSACHSREFCLSIALSVSDSRLLFFLWCDSGVRQGKPFPSEPAIVCIT